MKKLIFLSFLFFVMLLSCETEPGVTDLTDATFELVSTDVDATQEYSASIRATTPSGMKVSFRSSDIEFWASEGDFETLYSKNYVGFMDGDPALGTEGLRLRFSDTEGNMVFMPNYVKMENVPIPEFDVNATYDVIRIDLGDGDMTYTLGLGNVNINNSGSNVDSIVDRNSRAYMTNDAIINCINSIFLIDEAYLSQLYCVETNKMYGIINNQIDPSTLFSAEDEAFIEAFIRNNNNLRDADDNLMADYRVNNGGAIYIPFKPLELQNRGKVNKVRIKVVWDMDTIFSDITGDVYTLNTDADGTPYDFSVEVEIQ